MGVLETKNGKIFTIAQWPVCACMMMYEAGIPIHRSFRILLEYGDFDVSITAPANHVVVVQVN
jgi:hypothetical protein